MSRSRWVVPSGWAQCRPPKDRDTVLPSYLQKKYKLFFPSEDIEGTPIEWEWWNLDRNEKEVGKQGPVKRPGIVFPPDEERNGAQARTKGKVENNGIREANPNTFLQCHGHCHPCCRCISSHCCGYEGRDMKGNGREVKHEAENGKGIISRRAPEWSDIELCRDARSKNVGKTRHAPDATINCPYCNSFVEGEPMLDASEFAGPDRKGVANLPGERLGKDVADDAKGPWKIFHSNEHSILTIEKTMIEISPASKPHIERMKKEDWLKIAQHDNYKDITLDHPVIGSILVSYSSQAPRTHIWLNGISLHCERLVQLDIAKAETAASL